MHRRVLSQQGITFIDSVVGTALLLIVFLAVFGVLRSSVLVVSVNKSKVGAIALANDQLEFLRSLSYDDVGTVSGIPAGNIPQNQTELLNGISYNVRTFIQYVDAEEDGLAGADQNGITTDYKVAKVEVTWTIRGEARSVSAVTNISPPGIETTAGGGTLQINTLDALGAPLSGATVLIENTTTNPSISVSTTSNAAGQVIFGGAPEASDYEITVSKTAHSTAATYDTTAGNPNPSPAHLGVLASQLTSSSFQIDRVAEMVVETFIPSEDAAFLDEFSDQSGIATLSGTEVNSGNVRLLFSGGTYSSSGYMQTIARTDPLLLTWEQLEWAFSTPLGTSISLQIYYDNAGLPVLIPDADLPGNSSGFSSPPVVLSSLDVNTYDTLYVRANFSTADVNLTPLLSTLNLEYTRGPIPEPDIPFTLTGAKVIGTDASFQPIYKYDQSLTTDSAGTWSDTNLEWDNYTLVVDAESQGFDVSELCGPSPIALAPAAQESVSVLLVPDTQHTLRVIVRDGTGALLEDANVRLYGSGGYDTTLQTSVCGQVFFSGLTEGTVAGGDAYSLDVSKSGYTSTTITPLDVSDDTLSETAI